jgi:excisionase family DNA binding protein
MTDKEKWLRVPEAARKIGVSRQTMYRMLDRLAAEGVTIYRPTERVTLIDQSELERWMERQQKGGTGA